VCRGLGTGLLLDPEPTRVGYTFSKWAIGAAANTTEVTGDTAYSVLAAGVEKSSVTIYAQWVGYRVVFSVTSTGGVDSATVTASFNDVSIVSDAEVFGVGTLKLSVSGIGGGEYTYVWKLDGVIQPDAVTGVFTVENVSSSVVVECVVNAEYLVFIGEDFGVFTAAGDRTARIDAPYSEFVELWLDSQVVDVSDYTVAEGSTVITLKESYLKTFANGTYWFTAMFTDAKSEPIKLVINVPIDDIPEVIVPAGGRVASSNTLLGIAALGMLCLSTGRKRWLQQAH
jgi:hypothetical protein